MLSPGSLVERGLSGGKDTATLQQSVAFACAHHAERCLVAGDEVVQALHAVLLREHPSDADVVGIWTGGRRERSAADALSGSYFRPGKDGARNLAVVLAPHVRLIRP